MTTPYYNDTPSRNVLSKQRVDVVSMSLKPAYYPVQNVIRLCLSVRTAKFVSMLLEEAAIDACRSVTTQVVNGKKDRQWYYDSTFNRQYPCSLSPERTM